MRNTANEREVYIMHWYIFWMGESRLKLVEGPFTEATAHLKAAEGTYGYPLIRESYGDIGEAINEFVIELKGGGKVEE